ncbi:MAG: phosphate signaling complex protein PhoU [Acidobacteriota bacterium]
MAIHMLRDLEKLKKEILLVGSMVEEATEKSVLALRDRRADLAEEVKKGDKQIDDQEIKVEEECLKILALHQPVANDLRFVVAALKVNNDLERVGDLAGNLADRVLFLADRDPVPVPDKILTMADRVPSMLRRSLDAFVKLDTHIARSVLHEDEEVDATHAEIFGVIEKCIKEDVGKLAEWMQLLSVSRYLERIADLATNIAEDVLFMVDGEVVRHRQW